MAEELTGELISKWINFKLYSESVEGPFFSPSVLVYFKSADFLYSGLEPVKKFLKDFFNQGSSDCQIEIVASKMDIQGVVLVENLKIAITSKLPTVEWLFGKDVNYCDLTGKRVVLNTVMSIQFTNELLDKVIIDWDPKELEEYLLPEASQEEASVNIDEKNDTGVSGSVAETVETKPVEEQKAELEEPVAQEEPVDSKEESTAEGNPSEIKEEAIAEETPSDKKEEVAIQKEPSESKVDPVNATENSVETGGNPGPDDLPNNETQDKQETAVSIERDASQTQENEKAEVDTLVDSEGSAKSRSPAPIKNVKARANPTKTHSKNSNPNPKVKPSHKSSTGTKPQSDSSKPLSRSISQQQKTVDSSKSSFQAKPSVPRSGLSRTTSQPSVKTNPSTPRVVRRPGSQASHLSNRSFSSNISSTRPKSAVISSSERLSFLEFRPTSVGPSLRPLIRSSPAARNLVTSFSISGETTQSHGTPALQDNAWAKSLRPYLNKGSTGVRL